MHPSPQTRDRDLPIAHIALFLLVLHMLVAFLVR